MPRRKPQLRNDPGLAISYVAPAALQPTEQVSAVGTYCAGAALQLVGTFDDEAVLALPEREAFIDALVYMEAKGVGVLVTADVGVLATTAAEHALAERAVQRAGGRWVQVDPAVTWARRLVDDTLACLRQHESMIYRPKVRLGRQGGPEARPGGPAPWGFRRGDDGHWVEDADEQMAIREVLRMREEGAGLGALASYLQGLNLPARGPRVFKTTVKSILRRFDYRGGRP